VSEQEVSYEGALDSSRLRLERDETMQLKRNRNHKRIEAGRAARCLTLLILFTSSSLHAASLRLLVPAYGNPGNSAGMTMWNELTTSAATMQSDLVVILNPFNGPGASPIDANYVNGSGEGPVVDVRAAGARVIGYVRTDYTMRPVSEVQDDIDRYYDPSYWSGAGVQLDGIFIDEMSNRLADAGYYENLRDYVRAYDIDALVVGNPGTSFVDTANPAGQTIDDYVASVDTLVTFESSSTEYRSGYSPPSWLNDYPAERFAHIVYDEPSTFGMVNILSLVIDRKAGFAYVTDDDLVMDNPYDEIPSYWTSEVEAALGLVFADGFESGTVDRW